MNDQQFLTQLGRRIREIRIQKKIKQQDLAAKCNFEKSNMSRIEGGRSNVTILNLVKISQALEVDLTDLLNIK